MEHLTIKVHDHSLHPSPVQQFEISLPATSTVEDLKKEVSAITKKPIDLFDLKQKFVNLLSDSMNQDVLTAHGFLSEKATPVLMIKSEKAKQLDIEYTKKLQEQSAIPPKTSSQTTEIAPDYNLSQFPPLSSPMLGYHVGLSNQGATCYLNSLIQTLFMTPEFRAAIYDWSFDDFCRSLFSQKLAEKKDSSTSAENSSSIDDAADEEEKYQKWKAKTEPTCVPRQLQRLFLKLQLSSKKAITTTKLTKSFGWKAVDSFTQHDVQELNRVLCDALENVWKGTEKENLINNLYQGQMKDYVECLRCGYESARKASFLDVPLVLKEFGSTTVIGSVQEALKKFVEVEKLDGDNLYYCEKCNLKVEAKKGLKFTSLPYLLTLHLKRFDYDFELDRRIKLNHRVEFPEILDMNDFLNETSSKKEINKLENIEQPVSQIDSNKEEEETKSKDSTNSMPPTTPPPPVPSTSTIRNQMLTAALKNGPNVYELYSVLVHDGDAMKGHYYAYVWSFAEKQWYCFDDSQVSFIDKLDIIKAYGGSKSKGNSASSAYMLVYRRHDPERNISECLKEEIPTSLINSYEEDIKRAEAIKAEKERQKSMITFKVYYQQNPLPKEIYLNKDDTYDTLTKLAAQALNLTSYLPNRFRLRDYNTYYETPGKPYVGPILEQTLDEFKFFGLKSVMAETIENEELGFLKYQPETHFTVRLAVYDNKTEKWVPGIPSNNSSSSICPFLSVPKVATVHDLKLILEEMTHIPKEKSIVVVEANPPVEMDVSKEDILVKNQPYYCNEGTKIWVEERTEPQREEGAEETPKSNARAIEEINRIKNSIQLFFNEPSGASEGITYKHVVSIDKTSTLLNLKKMIQAKIKLSLDEFKVSKGVAPSYVQLKDENETLTSLGLGNGMKITVEKGKPMRKGEIVIKFVYFDPQRSNPTYNPNFNKKDNQDGKPDDPSKQTENEKDSIDNTNNGILFDLFQLAIPGKYTIRQAKQMIIEHFNTIQEEHQKKTPTSVTAPLPSLYPISYIGDVESLNIRLRKFNMLPDFVPGNILCDDMVINQVATFVYMTPEFAVQTLPKGQPEMKKSKDDDIVIFLQEFDPKTFTLGPKFEFLTHEDEKLGTFRDRICEEVKINSELGLVQADKFDGISPLSVPGMTWVKAIKGQQSIDKSEADDASTYDPQLTVRSLRLCDGDLLLYRDFQIPLKELTPEEEKVIKENHKKKISSITTITTVSSSRREENLVIKATDLSIDDI
eukprot:TRINITY_DN12247_c0_g1_i1.p1 TRINITY_DN12247_c0_g1~~TRINITY_DN12247_c0_g1_i1.p1  ORF type:complete len:1243 (+),score=262.55 TRINITY_DN12247_c0_g1_i1:103-3831(+)